MSKKSGLQRAGDLAHHVQAIRKIIMAAIKGGWVGAAVETVKHYWAYILPVAVALLMLPVIIFLCLPSMLFGFGNSNMAATASAAREKYDGYERYCNEYLLKLYSEVTESESSQAEQEIWETQTTGMRMDKNWFIVFHAVETGNDLEKITEETIKAQIPKIITYEIKDKEPETSSATASGNTTHEPEAAGKPTKLLEVHYLSPKGYMEKYQYSEADRNWAELMYTTMKKREKVASEIK